MELFIGIGRVQRRRGSSDGSGQKAHNRGQPIGQCNRNSIAAADARGSQGVRHFENLLPERIVGNFDSKLGDDNGGVTVSKM